MQNKIAGINPNVNSNMEDLKNAYAKIDSLKFWQFALDRYDTSLDGQIAKLKQQQNLIQAKIDELKKGKQDGSRLDLRNGSPFNSAPGAQAELFDSNDVMATGQRNLMV